MTGLVLYRKWRPRRLSEVVGQEPVTGTLRQALRLGRVAHAYLFTGPRGTGKTTTARILAKTANCLAPQDGEPCDGCRLCQAVNQGVALDLVEIDAASNRGIDEIRGLRERIHLVPNEGRYRVYIIDEVHMLTEPAFNALLKTLEEPPAHVIFVLATTEPHKVPATIASRCQRFDFRRLSLRDMVGRLKRIAQEEGISLPEEALEVLAQAASGSMRDAENLLEQAWVSLGGHASAGQVRELVGQGEERALVPLVAAVLQGRSMDGIPLLNEALAEGMEVRHLHRQLLALLRGALLLKSGSQVYLELSPEVAQEIKDLAEGAPLRRIVAALRYLGQASPRPETPSALPLELALAQCALAETEERPAEGAEAAPGPSAVARRPAREKAPGTPHSVSTGVSVPPGPVRQGATTETAERTREEVSPPAFAGAGGAARPAPSDAQQARLEAGWEGLVKALGRTKGKRFVLGALLRVCKGRHLEGETLVLSFGHRSNMERMQEEWEDPRGRQVLQEALEKHLGVAYRLELRFLGSEGNAGTKNASHLVQSALAMGAHIVDEQRAGSDEQ